MPAARESVMSWRRGPCPRKKLTALDAGKTRRDCVPVRAFHSNHLARCVSPLPSTCQLGRLAPNDSVPHARRWSTHQLLSMALVALIILAPGACQRASATPPMFERLSPNATGVTFVNVLPESADFNILNYL